MEKFSITALPKLIGMKRLFLAILLSAIQVSHVNAGWFGPSNYEDCILEGIPTARTDLAVKMVMDACMDKFPSEVSKARKETPRQTLGNPLGEYVCEESSWDGGNTNTIRTITVNEKTKRFVVHGGKNLKITRSTDSAIYTDMYDDGDFENIYWVFKRLHNNPYTDNETTIAELRYTYKPEGTSKTQSFICEKSI